MFYRIVRSNDVLMIFRLHIIQVNTITTASRYIIYIYKLVIIISVSFVYVGIPIFLFFFVGERK